MKLLWLSLWAPAWSMSPPCWRSPAKPKVSPLQNVLEARVYPFLLVPWLLPIFCDLLRLPPQFPALLIRSWTILPVIYLLIGRNLQHLFHPSELLSLRAPPCPLTAQNKGKVFSENSHPGPPKPPQSNLPQTQEATLEIAFVFPAHFTTIQC